MINLEPIPIQELTYQLSSLNMEMRNLCDVMSGLSKTISENTTFLEQMIATNEGKYG